MNSKNIPNSKIGIVVIGRNEGHRLKASLQAISDLDMSDVERICLYVDSASTDGSVEIAASLDVSYHVLDSEQPLSPARARREGAERILDANPDIDLLQFVDGDCIVDQSWIRSGVEVLRERPDVGIVCGRLREQAPGQSIYNRLNSLRWNTEPTGDIDYCGGNFMIRSHNYLSANGFNPRLLTGEEADLCLRVRSMGFRVVRVDAPMAAHDSNLANFRDWWVRAVWGGYGDALRQQILSDTETFSLARQARSVAIWGIGLPLIGVAGVALTPIATPFLILPLACVVAYAIQVLRVAGHRRAVGDGGRDAILYSAFVVLSKIPSAIGFLAWRLKRRSLVARAPDPHQHQPNQGQQRLN